MSHATYEWVMSHENESCHTHDTVMSRINELWHRQLSHVTHARVMSNINESRHTYERVKSSLPESWSKAPLHHTLQTHTRISHVTHDWVMTHWSHWHIDDTLMCTIYRPSFIDGRRLLCITLCRLTHELATSYMIESCQREMSHDTHMNVYNLQA